MATQADDSKGKKTTRKKAASSSRSRGRTAKKPATNSRKKKASATQTHSKTSVGAETIAAARQSEQSRSSETNSTISAAGENHSIGDHVWRLIAIVAFALIAYIVLPFVLFPLAAFQFFVIIFDSKPNEELQAILDIVRDYLVECLDFVIFRSDEMPFPFSPLPTSGRDTASR